MPEIQEPIHAPALRTLTAIWQRALAQAVVTLVLMLTFAGCVEADWGDWGVKDSMAADGELLARISAVLRAFGRPNWDLALAYVDFYRAREQLGLPRNADVTGPGKRRLLLSFATRPLFRFSNTAIGRSPRLGPLGDVLDTRKIEVAVGTNSAFSGPGADEVWAWDALLLRTRQPFREIARPLRREGYEETDDGLLVADRPPPRNDIDPRSPQVPFPAAGHAGGVVVFGGSARAVRAAQRGAGAEPVVTAALLAELPGVARVSHGSIAGGRSGRCVVAVGLGEDAAPREGQVVVIIDRRAEGRRLLFSGTSAAISEDAEVVWGEATAEGNRVSVPFSSTDQRYPTRLGVESVAVPYDCP